ncbi:prophage regulatory protein [Sphingobium wenxiniae]|uniref:AlpA family transcriptional regulator n=2 Tax=Sphingobium wenxiniae (strain DSM 21828 / CGMCC 1.7748 / JZ-1) TaxID=595605 RepID=A0A562KKZ2_SPHWJ|nr:prophage regulatory protein [Sphingobium wenxiniae]TWH96046.1 AlpA family transcriptional regulator [Sphingobium wenxiniae]
MNAMSSAPTREAYLRLPAVISATGLSKATIYRRIKAGEFPDAYSLGGHSVAWKRSELEDWMENRMPRAKPG